MQYDNNDNIDEDANDDDQKEEEKKTEKNEQKKLNTTPTTENIMKRTADADEKYQRKCVEFE